MRRVGLAVLVTFFLSGPLLAQADLPPVMQWKQVGSVGRQSYVGGYRDGRAAMARFYLLLRDSGQSSTPDEAALSRTLTPRQRELLASVYTAEWKRESLAGLDAAAIEATITDLYLDPANGLVPWGPMLQLAVERLRGTPWPKIEQALAGLRRAALEKH